MSPKVDSEDEFSEFYESVIEPFASKNIPEISDLNVFMKYRKRGIANKLLDFAENLVSKNFGF